MRLHYRTVILFVFQKSFYVFQISQRIKEFEITEVFIGVT